MAKKRAKRKFTNWDAVHELYKIGNLSLAGISEQYKADHQNSVRFKKTVSDVAIMKKAKEEKWSKSLAGKVQNAIQEKLVNAVVSNTNQKKDKEIVEEAAKVGAGVVMLHRKQIAALTAHEDRLLEELGAIKNKKTLKDLKMKSAILKDITQIRAQRIALERQAHNIKDDSVSDDKKIIRVRAID